MLNGIFCSAGSKLAFLEMNKGPVPFEMEMGHLGGSVR